MQTSLSKKRELTQEKYNENVRTAKILLQHINTAKFQVAKLALEVCDIRHGGRQPDDLYNLTKFANDVGMPFKTLSNWVRMYRDILLKINITDPTDEEWERARRLLDHRKAKSTIFNSSTASAGSKANNKHIFKKETPEEVLTQFNALGVNGKSYDEVTAFRCIKYLKDVRSKLKKLTTGNKEYSTGDELVVMTKNQLKELSREIIQILNDWE